MENKRGYIDRGLESMTDPKSYKNNWKKQKKDRERLLKIKEALKPITQLLKNVK